MPSATTPMLIRGPSKAYLDSGSGKGKEEEEEEEEDCVGPVKAKSECFGPGRRKRLIVYHNSGIYQVSPNTGSYAQVSSEGWSRVKAAAFDNDNTIYVFHDGGIFKMSVDSGTYTTLSGEGWFATTAAVYARGSLIVFHVDGIFRVNTSSGSYYQMSREGWSRVKAVAYDNDNIINVFHDGGIFQVRVDTGSYKTLSWRGWSATTAAVYARDSLIVFCAAGIFRVNAGNGSYTKISCEGWSRVRAAAYDNDSKVTVFHDGGIFQVSIDNGSYTMLSREGWSSTKAAVYTEGEILLDSKPPRVSPSLCKKQARSRGIYWAAFLVVVVLVWTEYGPVVGFRWKVLRTCLAVIAVLRLSIWSGHSAEQRGPSSVPPRKDAHSTSSEKAGDEFESEVEDPVRWSILPKGGGVLRSNTRSPVTHEDANCQLKILAMHRPTHETWREDMGKYPYSWHFSGRRRVWEIRLQVRFKRVPTSPLIFGIEMQYVPFTLSPWMKYMKTLILKAISSAIGGEVYQTPGEDPATVDGEAEPPTLAFPLWAIDQFDVANVGEEPDLTGDLEGVGLKRTSGLRNYIQALKRVLNEISTEKVYTLCVWGISQFLDAIKWEVSMAGFKVDPNQLCGKPPIWVVLYEMPGVKPGDADRRHLVSRKNYYLKVAVWNDSKPYEEAEVRSLEIGDSVKAGGSEMTERGSRRRAASSTAEWFTCCGPRP